MLFYFSKHLQLHFPKIQWSIKSKKKKKEKLGLISLLLPHPPLRVEDIAI